MLINKWDYFDEHEPFEPYAAVCNSEWKDSTLDAVLDELVAWLKLRREGGNLLTIQMIESKITSLRKAADTLKGGSR